MVPGVVSVTSTSQCLWDNWKFCYINWLHVCRENKLPTFWCDVLDTPTSFSLVRGPRGHLPPLHNSTEDQRKRTDFFFLCSNLLQVCEKKKRWINCLPVCEDLQSDCRRTWHILWIKLCTKDIRTHTFFAILSFSWMQMMMSVMKMEAQKRRNLLIFAVEMTFPGSSFVCYVVMEVLPFGQNFFCPLFSPYTFRKYCIYTNIYSIY